MLDPLVGLTVASLPHMPANSSDAPAPEEDRLEQDLVRAKQLRRDVSCHELPRGELAVEVAELAKQLGCDLIIVGKPEVSELQSRLDTDAIARAASCAVCVVTPPHIPQEAGE
jgi:nucleotide-binding universal stress UspA family protein